MIIRVLAAIVLVHIALYTLWLGLKVLAALLPGRHAIIRRLASFLPPAE